MTIVSRRPAPDAPVLSRRASSVLVGFVAVLLSAASTVPSPIYVVYQKEWRFDDSTVTVVFGVYCVSVLVSMLLFGSLSDLVGRRPVILLAVGAVSVATVVFLFAQGLPGLIAARAVQGFGGGIGASALAAALLELAPAGARWRGVLSGSVTPIIGIGAGALGSGLLVEYGPWPTRLPYAILLGLLVVSGLFVVLVPETAPCGAGSLCRQFRLAPRRIHVPSSARRAFTVLSSTIVAVWAVGGLYMALGPSVAAAVLGSPSRALGGTVIAVLAGSAALAQVGCHRMAPRPQLAAGAVAQLAGLVGVQASLLAGSQSAFLLGTVVLGFGWGCSNMAAFRLASALAPPERLGELVAATNIVAYLGTVAPTVAAGFATTQIGLLGATGVLIAGVASLVLVSVAGLRYLPASAQ
ncbi:MFS transporter [Amycolatopsis circi]|uniref:MFS transporter n=1 Tax=Amycolatopsis circi TaxID=871959 RepID=UPI000E248E39|nr:MFS transporter [Amycolatopsis circi]